MFKYLIFIFFLLSLILGGWLVVRQSNTPISLPDGSLASENQIAEKTSPLILPSPHFAQIFQADHSWTATLSAQKTITLLATGDVLTARTVNAKATLFNDFTWPWKNTAQVLNAADITFINLETPLVEDCPITQSGMIFCGDLRQVEGLIYGGVDVANLANNHMGNHDQAGVNKTVEVLSEAGIAVAGVSDRAIPVLNVKNQKFAFLGYNEVDVQPGVNLSHTELITKEITEAKKLADIVIVQFHWGNEYTYQPSSHQTLLAHSAIDSGADLIIGNHPHWWQPVEKYQGKFITYSHGNFIFDQMWSSETREGLVGKYTFYESKLVDIEFLPVLIENYGQPNWLEGSAKQKMIQKVKEKSAALLDK